jgi:vitamin B12 transport system permease protein
VRRLPTRKNSRCFIIGGILIPAEPVDQSIPATSGNNAQSVRPLLARTASGVMAAFGWLMCTLATGAVAAFVALVADIRPCWSILLLAMPLTLVLKFCGSLHARWAGSVAAIAILLAGTYAACLVAIARVAAATGFPFGQALRTGGVGLVLQVAKLGLSAVSILVYAGAAVLAAMLASWMTRPSGTP